ncbi:MAG: glycosyltransferase family 4 protein [Actinomycetota bacterium]|nr:glycosyltransferase family 4 protein [Actinomycetota bacterium]
MTSNFPRWEGDSTTPFVLHLAQDLQSEGWRVDVLAPGAEGAAGRETLGGVLVERFPYLWPASAQTVCYGGGALINIREHRLNQVKVPALVASEIVATVRRLRARRYDLVHSHWILPQGFTGALASRLLRRTHVLTVHGGDVFALRGRALQPFKRYALERADAVTSNAHITANAVRRIAPKVRDLRVIPMGVDVDVKPVADRVDALRQKHRRGQGPLVLFVGRLVEEKGVADLIRAIAKVKDQLPDVTAAIVGDGQHRTRFARLAVEAKVADRVSFTGWVPREDVTNYLGAADILAAPSRRALDGWVEAQGLSIIEGMTAGLPVVATTTGGIPDVVTDRRTGLLVPEQDPMAFAEAIEQLWSDRALAAVLGEEARNDAAKRFSRKASAQRFSSLFDDLLGGRRR